MSDRGVIGRIVDLGLLDDCKMCPEKDERIAKLEAALRDAKLKHRYRTEWECTAHAHPRTLPCSCGASEHNYKIDKALEA